METVSYNASKGGDGKKAPGKEEEKGKGKEKGKEKEKGKGEKDGKKKKNPSAGKAILAATKPKKGKVPYVFGGGSCKGPTKGGFDCSGFLLFGVCQATGLNLFGKTYKGLAVRVTNVMYCTPPKEIKATYVDRP